MPEFVSPRSYQQFEQSVKSKARFVHENAVREFLRIVLDTAKQRVSLLRRDETLFRAQLGLVRKPVTMPYGEEEIEVEVEAALSPERMIPKAEYVIDGRVNPRGIPCLYLATTASAVISEMRPWVGSYITLARFRTERDCQLVDCSLCTTPSWVHEFNSINLSELDETGKAPEPDAMTKENAVWGDIGFAFSKPVTHDEPHLDYIPTQVLAEAFRDSGYDGIVYKSLLDSTGKNVALFNPRAAILIPGSCCLYKARSAQFRCERVEEVHEGYRARPRCPESEISSHFEDGISELS